MTGPVQAMMGGGGAGGSSLALSLNTTTANGTTTGSTAISNTVTGTASGGTPPYTYAWTITPVSGATITALSPTSASTAFQVSGLGSGDVADATAVLRVTDNVGAIKDSAEVTIHLRNTGTP